MATIAWVDVSVPDSDEQHPNPVPSHRVMKRSESALINGELDHSGPRYVLSLEVPEGMELVGCDIPEGFTDKKVRIVSSIPPVGRKVIYE